LISVMVGTDKNNDGTTPAFVHDSKNNIVSLEYYDVRSVRPYRDTPLPIHDIYNQQYNMCARKFEYSGTDKVQKISYGSSTSGLIDAINKNPCSSLNSGRNPYRGHTNWRVPNQKEMSIMRNLGLVTSSGSMLSCTREYFDIYGIALGTGDRRFLVASSGHTYALTASNGDALYVRCVRDVE